MSVLIEALTLVVRKRELDIRYPGGTDAFLQAALELEAPPRFICNGDPHLVNLSFSDPDHLAPCVALLEAHGFMDVDDGKLVDMAYVDQHFGPTMPCDWLEWRRHPDGFTYAWLAGTEPGDMATDEDWTPERSRGMKRFDVRDEPGRMFRLAEEDGIETWLDTRTGKQVVGLAHREPSSSTQENEPMAEPERGLFEDEPENDEDLDSLDLDRIIRDLEEDLGAKIEKPKMGRLMRSLLSGVEALGWEYRLNLDHYILAMSWTGPRTEYRILLLADEDAGVIGARTSAAFRVPPEKRVAMCEAINRANWGLRVGSFEMDMDDGEVVFRVGLDHQDSAVSARLVARVVQASLGTFERYVPAFMRVIYGGATAMEAIHEVENG